ncbi:MAG: hypothetical protein RL347_1043 [Actinomycetota bacterium]|jgi:aryl-alcohol dehydrogenase-like predicted oxidoreductase
MRPLGASGARVGVVGLGTTPWGRGTDRFEAREQVNMLLEAGGNLIDICAHTTEPGFVHEALGPHRRATFIALRTRVAPSRRELLVTLDRHIEETGIGYADLWLVDGWDDEATWEEVVAALAVASATGRAMYAGACPSHAWQAALVGAGLAAHQDRSSLTAMAFPYSLLDARAATDLVDVSSALGCGLLATRPLAGGVLTGKYRHATPPDSRGAGEHHAQSLHAYRRSWARPVVEAVCAAADGLGLSPGALALAWVRDRPEVSSVLVGARTTHQWRAALASAEVTVPPEIRQVLDDLAAEAVDLGQDDWEV